jgi:HSP20 family protein
MSTFIRLQRLNKPARPMSCRVAPPGANAYLTDDLVSSVFRLATGGSAHAIPLDVAEDDKAYRVWATIPGVKKEDIQLAVENNEVSIDVDIKPEMRQEGERVLHTERFVGKTSRRFSVAEAIDEAAIEAKYSDGVLSLVLPKKLTAAAKRISIN